MKKRNVVAPLILLVLVFLAFLIRRWNEPAQKEAFDRRPALLVYTKHALCRMDCRQISKAEIMEIMQKGAINFNRSNRRASPCPVFALQGRTAGGDRLRVFFMQCPAETKVITCYNLDDDVACHCSGDDKKKNR